MKNYILPLSFVLALMGCHSSDEPTPPTPNLYFPPTSSTTWETTSASSLGWDESKIAELDAFMENTDTRALLVLKNGKMVIEKYAGTQLLTSNAFTANSNWYWASAGKTLTASLIGIAENKGQVDLDAPTSDYLGVGWTSLTSDQEIKITIRHQLTMTTGLDDWVNPDCTDPDCLIFKAVPGQRWAYHNAPYTLLDSVIESSTGKNLNAFLNDEMKTLIGMDGQYIQTGDNNVYYSTPRSMARFGLLLLNEGKWDQTQIIPKAYVDLMVNTSQSLNLSYGYLTWLNGKASYMAPGLQLVFSGSLSSSAPDDMFAAMGKNGQLINIVPSQKLIVIRMGDAPTTNLVPFTFQNDLWDTLNEIINN